MKYIKTVGDYEIFEASREECKKGYMGMPWAYPCFCVFYKDEEPDEKTPRIIGRSESDFGTLEEAEKWSEDFS